MATLMEKWRGPNADGCCPENFDFACKIDGCTEMSFNADDFVKCEGCEQHLCAEHRHAALDTWWCFECWRNLDACPNCGEILPCEVITINGEGYSEQYCPSCVGRAVIHAG